MQSAFPIVVFGTVGLSVVMSIVFLLSKGSMYDEIGSGGLPGEGETPGGGSPFGASAPDYDSIAMNPALQQAEREQEIRQLLQARSDRRVRRGETALDIDAEVAKLLAAAPASTGHDPGIAEEVLQLVVARNERRERQGLEPLDIEAEVARTLAELDP
ncbi:MAG TPA: hypothetical protein VG053_03090 [Solirubrobacteraceae bacterium]|jgi:hypothetical protein|nr:hypothetical protein [Solirubrobacteraceae bacterium]